VEWGFTSTVLWTENSAIIYNFQHSETNFCDNCEYQKRKKYFESKGKKPKLKKAERKENVSNIQQIIQSLVNKL
jgi:hypothetical protein